MQQHAHQVGASGGALQHIRWIHTSPSDDIVVHRFMRPMSGAQPIKGPFRRESILAAALGQHLVNSCVSAPENLRDLRTLDAAKVSGRSGN